MTQTYSKKERKKEMDNFTVSVIVVFLSLFHFHNMINIHI